MNLEDVQKLLETGKLNGDERQLNELVKLTEALVASKGEDWVRVHKHLLIAQWDRILELGI
jgi:hypothetical protein